LFEMALKLYPLPLITLAHSPNHQIPNCWWYQHFF
jgi:hypothetical protein